MLFACLHACFSCHYILACAVFSSLMKLLFLFVCLFLFFNLLLFHIFLGIVQQQIEPCLFSLMTVQTKDIFKHITCKMITERSNEVSFTSLPDKAEHHGTSVVDGDKRLVLIDVGGSHMYALIFVVLLCCLLLLLTFL